MNTQREVVKTTITSNMDDPKNEGTPEVTKEYVVYPEGTPIGKYSASGDFPMAIYDYGNAKVSAHISMPFMADPLDPEKTSQNLMECVKSVHQSIDDILTDRITEYTDLLDSRDIDWVKVKSEMKKGK